MIILRGRALGVTMFLPERDRYSYTRQRLMSQIASLFGGRLAEELIFGKENVTTGASNDIERATSLARNMVTKWGLSEKLGPLTYGAEEEEVFLGRSVQQTKEISDATTHTIDAEVRHIIDENYDLAKNILEEKMDILHAMADALMKYETIDEHQLKQLMNREAVSPPKGWNDPDKPVSKDDSSAKSADDSAEKKSSGDDLSGAAGTV